MASFQERMEHLNLDGEEGKKALRWLLEHLANHDQDPNFLAARVLMEHAETAENLEKNLLLAEMFAYLVRALEDFGACCLMWLAQSKHPVEAYLAARPEEIREFYASCRKGLAEEKLAKIYGVARGETLCDLNWLSRAKAQEAGPMLEKVTARRLESLALLARVYHQSGPEANNVLGPWQAAASKSGSFHLVKAGQGDDATQNLLLGVGDAPRTGAEGAPVPSLFFLKLELPGDFAERIFTQIDEVLVQRVELARLRMDLSYDPRAALNQAQQAWDEAKAGAMADKDKAPLKPAEPGPKLVAVKTDGEPLPKPVPAPEEGASPKESKGKETRTDVVGGLKIKRGLDELWS